MKDPPLQIIGNIALVRTTYPDERRYAFVGGAATHIALAVARQGRRCGVLAVIGPDLAASKQDLRDHGVNVDDVHVAEARSCSFELEYTRSGTIRTTRSAFGAGEQLTDHVLNVMTGDAPLHVCCRRPLDVARLRPALRGRRFSVDFFMGSTGPNLIALGPQVHEAEAIFVNAAEFAVLRPLVDVSRLRLIVVTDGPRTAVVMRHGSVVAQARPPRVDSVEVTGAGDTVTGVFLAAKAGGHDDHEALRSAVETASRSVTRIDLSLT